MTDATVTVGQTIYIEGYELVVAQVRLDKTASGTTAMIQLADPILYTKEKIDYEARKAAVEEHRKMIKAVSDTMGGEGGR